MLTLFKQTAGTSTRSACSEDRTTAMTSRYASFLIRQWLLHDGQQRVAVEHIQSGRQIQLTTLDEVCAWIASLDDDLPASATTATPRAASAAARQSLNIDRS